MLRRLMAVVALAWPLVFLAAAPARALTVQVTVVANCGTPDATLTAGEPHTLMMDTTGRLCVGSTDGSSVNSQNQLWNGSGWESWFDSHVTGAGDVYVVGSQLPNGASTSALQTAANASLATIATNSGLPLPAGTANIGSTIPMAVTPATGAATTVVTGGTANNAVTGPVNGCTLTNPTTATEKLYVNFVGAATTTESVNTFALAAGQTFNCIPGQTTNVSVNAATNGHAFSVAKW